MRQKLEDHVNQPYDIIDHNDLPLGIRFQKKIHNVGVDNPMVLVKFKFWDQSPLFVTAKHFHSDPIRETPSNVLIIGIGYTKSLRDQWFSTDYPIKRALISQNPLVAATLPHLDKMKCYDYERSEYVAPSNAINRNFFAHL